MSETPITRVEKLAAAIVNGNVINEKGIPRMAHYLKHIMLGTTATEEPQTRAEHYLAKIAGMDVQLEEPVTRLEKYLASIAGMDVGDLPAPVTRLEHLLYDWAEASSGELKTVSGSVISIADALAKAVDDLSVAITPIQDLHGYDKPWVGGAGKNICPPVDADWFGGYLDTTGVFQSDTTNGEKTSPFIEVSASQSYVFSYSLNGTPSGPYWACICFYNSSKALTGNRITDGHALTKYDVVGTSPADAAYIRISFRSYGFDSTVQIEKGSTASAWTPYSNICPISGHSAVNVTRTGKNLLDPAKRTNSSTNIRFNYSDADFLFKNGITYTISVDSVENVTGTYILDSNGSSVFIKYGSKQYSFTPTEDFYGSINLYWNNAPTGGTSSVNCQLEVGSTATAYTPYVGDTYTVDWTDEAGTVYGGSLDVTTGVLTVDRPKVVFDGTQPDSEFAYAVTTDGYHRIAWTRFIDIGKAGSKAFLSDKLKTEPNYLSDVPPWSVANSGASVARCFIGVPDEIASVSDWQSYVTNNPIMLVYELEEPITYQLTPTEVQMLLGNNTVWADTGDSTLQYWAEV